MSEKRLKDYKGFSIWKCKDGKGEIFYTANDKSENIFNVTLSHGNKVSMVCRY